MNVLKIFPIFLILAPAYSAVVTSKTNWKKASYQGTPAKERPIEDGKVIFVQDGIEGRFIINYEENVNLAQKEEEYLAGEEGRTIKRYKKVSMIVADELSQADLESLKADPQVIRIEQDKEQPVLASCEQFTAYSWNQDRADEGQGALNKKMTAYISNPNVFEQVTAYMLDTGIQAKHPDFQNRASTVFSSIEGEQAPFDDFEGHGTFTAGIVAGIRYGASKEAQLKGIQVVDSLGFAKKSNFIAGVNFVIKDHSERKKANPDNFAKSVGVAPLAFGFSRSINTAVAKAVEQGIPMVVAAGNNANSTAFFSPAQEKEAITVAATTKSGDLAPFSNNGSRVDINAPGVRIKSLKPTTCSAPADPTAVPKADDPCMTTTTKSGTSAASALVAGIIVNKMQSIDGEPPSPADLKIWLRNNAINDGVQGPFERLTDTTTSIVQMPKTCA